MPFQPLPNTNVQYALIHFDGNGVERTDDPEGGVFSKTLLKKIADEKPTHVFLFSHGWKGDVPSAIDQYNRWIGALWKLDHDRQQMGPTFKPLFIGLHWPSEPWGEESLAASFGADESSDTLLETAVEHFGGGDEVRRPLKVIVDAYNDDPTARELPAHVVAAYHELAGAIGFSAGSGPDAPPDQEGAPLDPQEAVTVEENVDPGVSFGIFGSVKKGILAGLRQASFWLMKHRARSVGEQGMHRFVAELQQVSDAKVHLMGHSFGCIVVSSILGGPNGEGKLPRPADSAVLVQGALSLWGYASKIPDADKPGYFRHVLESGLVNGPIVTTQSTNDSAVGLAFPAAVGLVGEFDFPAGEVQLPKFGGIGAWGIQGTTVAETRVMLDERGDYKLQPRRIYNVDGSRFIPGHSGIDGPEVAHLQWQAVMAGEQ
jgi:hypothetical protein